MNSIGLMGLVQMDLPTGTVRLSEAGFLVWAGNTYSQRHATFGVIASINAMSEGTGQTVPALEMVLLPSGTASASSLSAPGFQNSRMRFWIAEYNADTGVVIGTPQLQFDGQLDQTVLRVTNDGARELAITVVSTAERFFARNLGNTLSAAAHKGIWAGETGMDNATGLTFQVAWGVEAGPGGGRVQVTNPANFMGLGETTYWA